MKTLFRTLSISALEEFAVFGDATGDALAPEPEAGWLEMRAHVANDLSLTETGAFPYLIKAGAIMPRHADDVIALCGF